MSIEIYFGGSKVTDAPFNDKFGEVDDINDAIARSKDAHEDAGGDPLHVDDENVAIVADGQNLWTLWETHAKDKGVSWEAFLQNNMHLRDPKNLNGEDQSGWKDYWLVHEGDVVFIPDGPQPVTVDDPNRGENLPIAEVDLDGDGKTEWVYQVWGATRPESQTELAAGHILTYNGVVYEVEAVDHVNDTVTMKPKDNSNGGSVTYDLNEITK